MSGSLPLDQLTTVLIPLVVFTVTLAAGFFLRGLLFSRLTKWATTTATSIDDIVISSLRTPSRIWCLMLAAFLALESSQLPEEAVFIIGKVLLGLGIFSAPIVAASIAGQFIKLKASRIEHALPVTSLTQNLSRILIFGTGILIILNSFGISITPILATLGVGGLAVALALQDTLSNLFSGFHIIVSRQIRVGDYIKLETGQEGYVIDINWRTTQVKMLPNNVVLVPNAKLIQAIVVNYYMPDKETAVLVEVGVHYDSDLKKVERVTCEVAKEVMQKVEGGAPDFEPFIRYHTFADSSINFTAILRAREFADQYLVKHEFIKRLHERYKKEGIVIPYPIRTVYSEREKAVKP